MALKKPIDKAIQVNGQKYFVIKDFARITNRSEGNVRKLILQGNKIRKLRVDRVAEKPLIPVDELTQFPFTSSGRNNEDVYHYTEDGKVKEESPK